MRPESQTGYRRRPTERKRHGKGSGGSRLELFCLFHIPSLKCSRMWLTILVPLFVREFVQEAYYTARAITPKTSRHQISLPHSRSHVLATNLIVSRSGDSCPVYIYREREEWSLWCRLLDMSRSVSSVMKVGLVATQILRATVWLCTRTWPTSRPRWVV